MQNELQLCGDAGAFMTPFEVDKEAFNGVNIFVRRSEPFYHHQQWIV